MLSALNDIRDKERVENDTESTLDGSQTDFQTETEEMINRGHNITRKGHRESKVVEWQTMKKVSWISICSKSLFMVK